MYNELISISILTKDRSELVGKYLEYVIDFFNEQRIDIYVFDGSTDSKTQNVVSQFTSKYHNIEYRYYDENGKLSLTRFKDCFRVPNTEYVWMSGDNFRASIDTVKSIIGELKQNSSVELLTFYDAFCKYRERTVLNDFGEFLKDIAVPLTHWGSSLVKKSKINTKVLDEYWRAGRFMGSFPVMYMFARCFNKQDFNGVYLFVPKKSVDLNTNVICSTRIQHRTFEAYLVRWNEYIDMLPKEYDYLKEDLYKALDKNINFFCRRALLEMRISGEIYYSLLFRYKEMVQRSLKQAEMAFRYCRLPKFIVKHMWKREFVTMEYLTSQIRRKKEKIIIYGIGTRGKVLLQHLQHEKLDYAIVALSDVNYKSKEIENYNVICIDEAIELEYDWIVVSILADFVYENIRESMIGKGIKARKIIKLV